MIYLKSSWCDLIQGQWWISIENGVVPLNEQQEFVWIMSSKFSHLHFLHHLHPLWNQIWALAEGSRSIPLLEGSYAVALTPFKGNKKGWVVFLSNIYIYISFHSSWKAQKWLDWFHHVSSLLLLLPPKLDLFGFNIFVCHRSVSRILMKEVEWNVPSKIHKEKVYSLY